MLDREQIDVRIGDHGGGRRRTRRQRAIRFRARATGEKQERRNEKRLSEI